MVRIPSEYQEVEYLESTGTQFIDTGFCPNNGKYVFAMKIVPTEVPTNSDYFRVFGNVSGSSNNVYRFQTRINGSQYRFCPSFGTRASSEQTVNQSYYIRNNVPYEITINGIDQSYSVGDFSSSFPLTAGGTNETPIVIFASARTVDLRSKFRLYYFSVTGEDTQTILNLIPCYRKSDSEPGMYDTVSGTFYTNSGTGTFLVGNDVSWDTASLLERRRQILLNTPHIETASGGVASFKTDMATKLKGCKVYFSPVQEGSGDPSPDNVRPITGWDGVTIWRTGKNLVNVQDMKDTYPWSSSPSYKSYCLFVGANKTVTVSCASALPSGKEFYLILSGNAEQKDKSQGYWMYHSSVPILNHDTVTVTVDSNGYLYITLLASNIGLSNFYDYILDNQFQVEYGNISTDYEPYSGTTLTIPFPQTIYGGYVDLMKGEVVETWNSKTIDGTNIQDYAGNGYNGTQCTNRYLTFVPNSSQSYQTNTAISNYLESKKYSIWSNANNYPNCFTINGNYQLHVCFLNDIVGITSDDSNTVKTNKIKAYLVEHPMQLVYPLKTADMGHYSLTPQTIKALKGINNIFSDTNGNVEVKFYTH